MKEWHKYPDEIPAKGGKYLIAGTFGADEGFVYADIYEWFNVGETITFITGERDPKITEWLRVFREMGITSKDMDETERNLARLPDRTLAFCKDVIRKRAAEVLKNDKPVICEEAGFYEYDDTVYHRLTPDYWTELPDAPDGLAWEPI